MSGSFLQLSLFALGGCIAGFLIAWSIFAAIGNRRVRELTRDTRVKIKQVTRQRVEIATKYLKSKSTIERLREDNRQSRRELDSVVEKSRSMTKNVRTLLKEREKTKVKLSAIQDSLVSLRQKSAALKTEFDNSRAFYKRELRKSFEKRQALEEDIEKARAEQESFTRLVESSVLEHGSPENMIAAAQLRFGQLEVLQRTVNKLEAKNSELQQDIARLKQELEARDRDLAKLEELKLHNKQLVSCVEALEGSRQEHEADAERYREKANQSEQESETLRLRLDDLEKGFADIEAEQHEALEDARDATIVPILSNQA